MVKASRHALIALSFLSAAVWSRADESTQASNDALLSAITARDFASVESIVRAIPVHDRDSMLNRNYGVNKPVQNLLHAVLRTPDAKIFEFLVASGADPSVLIRTIARRPDPSGYGGRLKFRSLLVDANLRQSLHVRETGKPDVELQKIIEFHESKQKTPRPAGAENSPASAHAGP